MNMSFTRTCGWLLTVVFALTISPPARAADEPIGPEKKVIMVGGSSFPPGGWKAFSENVAAMEKRVPVDGLAFYPPYIKKGEEVFVTGYVFRSDQRLEIEDFAEIIADLRSAKTQKYKHNFLYAYAVTGDPTVANPDWFDDEDFEVVVNNWKTAADFCKRAGLVGIMFDDEMYYGTQLLCYKGSKYEKTKTFKQYADQVFFRGAQIMRAINTVYPDIHILSLHGPSQALGDPPAGGSLMGAFFDGLLSECTGNAKIIDGHEMAYGYRWPITYASARRVMKEEVRKMTRVPEKFDRHFRAAFSFAFFPGGHYTPEEFEYSLHQALKYTDDYVWIYTQGYHWWEKATKPDTKAVPKAYRQALESVRRPHHPPPLRNIDAWGAGVHPGSSLPPRKLGYFDFTYEPVAGYKVFLGYDEEKTFGDLWQQYEELGELSHLWRFRVDPMNFGVDDKWFLPGQNERYWFWITSALPWDEQGYRLYDGYGWYRQEFDAPSLPRSKKVYLAFGAVAHGAEVYVNGVLAGQHNMNGWAYSLGVPWQKRFLVDVTKCLRSGEKNTVTVRVVDYGPWGGGIWKPVKLIVEK